MFRKTYFGVTLLLSLILPVLLSDLHIRFHSLCLGIDVRPIFLPSFPYLSHFYFSFWHNIQTISHLCGFSRIPRHVKKSASKRPHRDQPAAFVVSNGNYLLFVPGQVFINSKSFLSTVFLYSKVLCFPSLCDKVLFLFFYIWAIIQMNIYAFIAFLVCLQLHLLVSLNHS